MRSLSLTLTPSLCVCLNLCTFDLSPAWTLRAAAEGKEILTKTAAVAAAVFGHAFLHTSQKAGSSRSMREVFFYFVIDRCGLKCRKHVCVHYSNDSLTAALLMSHLFWLSISAKSIGGIRCVHISWRTQSWGDVKEVSLQAETVVVLEHSKNIRLKQIRFRTVDTERRYFPPQQLWNVALQLWWIQCGKTLTCELSIKIREGRSVLDSRSDCLPNCCCRWSCRASYLLPTFACNGRSWDTCRTC